MPELADNIIFMVLWYYIYGVVLIILYLWYYIIFIFDFVWTIGFNGQLLHCTTFKENNL